MGRSTRFLLQFTWPNLGAVLGFAAVVIAGCYAVGADRDPMTGSLFERYYDMFPIMLLLCMFLYGCSLCTSNLNLGLAMGSRRVDFFWAVQGNFVLCAAACWGLQQFMAVFPALAGWAPRERWAMLHLFSGRAWAFPLMCAALMVLGCLCGLVLAKSKLWGTLLITLSILAAIGVTVVLLLSADSSLMDYLYRSRWGWLWSALPSGMTALLGLGAAGGELMIWRTIQGYVVR